MSSVSRNLYNPKTVDIDRLATLLKNLSPEQREILAIRLDPKAIKQLEQSKRDIKAGKTVPLDEW